MVNSGESVPQSRDAVLRSWARYDYRLDRFVDEVLGLAKNGAPNEALGALVEFASDVGARDGSIGRVFASSELDAACLQIGAIAGVSLDRPVQVNPGSVVFVVTALYPWGGHTRMLKSWIEQERGATVTVLVSDTLHRQNTSHIEGIMQGASAETRLAPPGDHLQTMKWLQTQLLELRPTRTYLMQHHYDAPAVAALQPELVGELYFSHHGDHTLTLGARLAHARHIDHTAKAFFRCRESEGINDNVMWPFSRPAPLRLPDDNTHTGPYITCCCGSPEKFDEPNLLESFQYGVAYSDVVVKILQSTGGRHVHIGVLTDSLRARIEGAMFSAGLERNRFVHVDFEPSLAEAFYRHEVDIYVCSVPRGGGLATVEAMAAARPILAHTNYRSPFLSSENEVYEGAMLWRTLEELSQLLRNVTRNELAQQRDLSRRYYEMHHAPEVLAAAMHSTFAKEPAALPPRPSHHPHALQQFLDERACYEKSGFPGVTRLGYIDLERIPTFRLLFTIFDRFLGRLASRAKRLFDRTR